MPLPLLRDAGFVEATVNAQRRVYRIRHEPLQEVDASMAPFRRYWSANVDELSAISTGSRCGRMPSRLLRLNADCAEQFAQQD